MAEKELVDQERLDRLRILLQRAADESLTTGPRQFLQRQFLRNLLAESVPDLLAHIEAQAEQIAQLESALKVTWIPCEERMPGVGASVWAKPPNQEDTEERGGKGAHSVGKVVP